MVAMNSRETRVIALTNGGLVLVDAEDYAALSAHRWRALRSAKSRTTYAGRWVKEDGKRGLLLMHREILGLPSGVPTDHVNGDGLDNRRVNLRAATHTENMWNSSAKRGGVSRYKGIWLFKESRPARKGGCRWRASIRVNGKRIRLGSFDSEIEAALAYDQAARKYHGEFARLNFPEVY